VDGSAPLASELRADTAYAHLSVADTGAGMSEEVRARLFEPFFTTKAKRGGTGLGLANVYTIVQHCGGHIEVNSEPGAGSVFRIYMPLARDPLVATLPSRTTSEPLLPAPLSSSTLALLPPLSAAAELESPLNGASGRSATVLVVDDDDATRRLMLRALKRAGYHALAAENAFVAQRLFDEHVGSLVLTITDVQMPGMDGPQLAELLSARLPAMKLLFVSGDNPLSGHPMLDRPDTFLHKPFSPQVFLERVSMLIGSSERGPAAHLASGRGVG
jgi:CheY-like chemotaxis protein